MGIRNFRCKETAKIWQREFSKKFSKEIQVHARRRLLMLDSASSLDDLRFPPSNRLEKLKGDRKGQYSIRINDQWRICFHFREGEAFDVEIIDYH